MLEDIDHSRTRQDQEARKRMASSSGSTRRCSMSSIASPFARRSTARSPISRSILIAGSKVTMRKGRTKDDGASAKRRCRRSLTRRRLRRRNDRLPDHTSTGGTDLSPDADRQIKCQLLQIMGPILPERLSALVESLGSHRTASESDTAIPYSTAPSSRGSCRFRARSIWRRIFVSTQSFTKPKHSLACPTAK